jgi:hypothetical protein
MTDNRTGGPAFPTQLLQNQNTGPELASAYYNECDGISLRDYYRAHAPPLPSVFVEQWFRDGLKSYPAIRKRHWLDKLAHVERNWRDTYADAMLKEATDAIAATEKT